RLMETGAGEGSTQPTDRVIQQEGMGDMSFITQKLLPMCVADGSEDLATEIPQIANYTSWYDTSNNVLHCHPLYNESSPIMRRYTYARYRTGTVLSFEPRIDELIAAATGGWGVQLGGTDSTTLKPINV